MGGRPSPRSRVGASGPSSSSRSASSRRSRSANDGEEAVIAEGYPAATRARPVRAALSRPNDRVASETRPFRPPEETCGPPPRRRRPARAPPRRPRHRRAAGHVHPRRRWPAASTAAMTVASAWVIGEITDRVLLPGLRRRGDHGRRADPGRRPRSSASPLLKIVGILGRRLFAGDHELPAAGRLPPPGHPPVPAAAAVLAPAAPHRPAAVQRQLRRRGAWFFVAPLPFACGALVMIAITVVALVLTDPLLALVGLVVFPLVFVVNVVYSQVMSPRMQRAQQLRAEVSEIAHESFDAALVVKTLGREDAETERFARPGRGAARRAGRRRPGARPVRPDDGGAAEPGHARRPADRRRPGRRRQHRRRRAWSPSPTCSPCWRCPSARSAGCWPTCRARWPASTGSPRCSRPPARRPYGPDAAPAGTGGAGARACTDVGFAFDGADPPDAVRASPSTSPAGSTVAVVGPTGSGKSTLAGLLVRLVDPADGARAARRRRPAPAARGRGQRPGRLRRPGHLPLRRHRPRQRHPRRRLHRRRGLGGAARGRRRRLRRRAARRASTPGSASAAPPCPAVSGSGWRWPAPSSAVRGCWSSTTRPAPSTPSVEARILDALRASDEPGDRRRHRLPAGHHRAGRRGGLARAGPGARPRHPRASCSPRCPATPRWSAPTRRREVAA